MNELFDLSGVRALITGAGRGIGAVVAEAFVDRGASVALVARSAGEVEKVAADLSAKGGRAVAHTGDVTDDASVAALVPWVNDELGGHANVVVNNAGIYIPNPFLDYSIEDWTRTFDANVLGTVRVTRAFLPAMLEAGSGRIINIASTAGKYGSMNQAAYNASKHAVVGITKCLALETAAKGVRVNAVCPGFVDTPLLIDSPLQGILGLDEQGIRNMIDQRTPIGRAISPAEVAALTAYLASPEADGMTGAAVTLAGGLVLV